MSNAERLKEILSRSKAVMQITEQNHGSTSNGSQSNEYSSEEKEIPNLTENFIRENQRTSSSSVAPVNGKYRNINKSKMPEAIKRAMIDNPIDIPESPYHTFELEDVPELLVNEQRTNIQPKKTNKVSNVNETVKSTINESSIRKIVREEIESVVRTVVEEYFDKSLVTEDIQIKVGQTIFSGKLKPLPSKRK